MSDFISMLVDLLPEHNKLHDENNPLRIVLDRTVGEYMDNFEPVDEQLFVTYATGGWLDAHGKDYGVPRHLNEDDESYRKRIIYHKMDYLTVDNLREIYGLTLYAFVSDYNPKQNTLTSDNPYSTDKYMSYADAEIQKILNNKFIIDGGVEWL